MEIDVFSCKFFSEFDHLIPFSNISDVYMNSSKNDVLNIKLMLFWLIPIL